MYRLFKRKDINDDHWDELINSSPNGVIYALTYFLDTTIHSWEAIIDYDESQQNPYRLVMPLIVGRKYGLKYIAYEPYVVQLGIFSKEALNQSVFDSLIRKVRTVGVKINHYPFETSLSTLVQDGIAHSQLSTNQLNSFDLKDPYEDLSSRYNRNRKRSLAKAKNHNLKVLETNDFEPFAELFRKHTYPKIIGMELCQLDQLREIHDVLSAHHHVEIYQVSDNDEVLSSGLFLKFRDTLTYSFCTNSPLGTSKNAQSLLLDHVIKKYAESEYILEAHSGSHVGVGYFYKSFGAKVSKVLVWKDQKINPISLMLNLIKRKL